MENQRNSLRRGLLAWMIALLMGAADWQLTLLFVRLDLPIRWWSFGLALGLIHAILGWALAEALLTTRISSKWSYRLSFLVPFFGGVFLWFQHPFAWILLPVIGLAAFLGSLIASRRNLGFWEDNYPPPKAVRTAVYQKHQEIIGTPPPVPAAKRLFDIFLSVAGLVFSSPVGLLALFAIWFEDPGPLFFVKNSVGRGGKNFHQFKLRTMVRGAEALTGPVMASEEDLRALKSGRFLRKAALDELPQLINILRGDMSFVGPRPQRTVLVADYLKTIPEFAERHRVLPGLAGLAQVAGSYHITPRQKLRYDRLYARHASLGFDIKLILLAFGLVFYLRWKPGGLDRIPRSWLH